MLSTTMFSKYERAKIARVISETVRAIRVGLQGFKRKYPPILITFTIALVLPAAIALADEGDPAGVLSDVYSISVPEGGSLAATNLLLSADTDPSSGAFHATIPIQLNRARGLSQPDLNLYYNSSAGNRHAGRGWGFELPSIQRRSSPWPPSYKDPVQGQPITSSAFDSFEFNGQPLVAICMIQDGVCTAAPNEEMPSFARIGGWHYFRLQTEGLFARFFWSPDHFTWVIQFKSGMVMELGVLRPRFSTNVFPQIPQDNNAIDDDRLFPTPCVIINISGSCSLFFPFRWNVVLQYDEQNIKQDIPTNVIWYRWQKIGESGIGYLTDVFDTYSDSNLTGARPDWAHHTRLIWEPHPDRTKPPPQIAIWRATPSLRLKRIDITSKDYHGVANRQLVRRYHLSYYSDRYPASYLRSVQLEGRCDAPVSENESGGNFVLPEETLCAKLPPSLSNTVFHR
jgi:Salmonella virulence plasmid 65kDa B protein